MSRSDIDGEREYGGARPQDAETPIHLEDVTIDVETEINYLIDGVSAALGPEFREYFPEDFAAKLRDTVLLSQSPMDTMNIACPLVKSIPWGEHKDIFHFERVMNILAILASANVPSAFNIDLNERVAISYKKAKFYDELADFLLYSGFIDREIGNNKNASANMPRDVPVIITRLPLIFRQGVKLNAHDSFWIWFMQQLKPKLESIDGQGIYDDYFSSIHNYLSERLDIRAERIEPRVNRFGAIIIS